MYWTDWGLNSNIGKAKMDGTQQRVLVDTGVGHWPNGLTLDAESQLDRNLLKFKEHFDS